MQRKFPAFGRFMAAAISAALLCGIVAAKEKDKEQTWFGTLSTAKAKLRMKLELKKDDDGGWTGVVISQDQGNARIQLDSVQLENKQLTFKAKSVGAAYSGKISDGEIDGTFTQSGQEFALKFRQQAEEAVKPLSVWVGTLNALGQELQIQVRQMPTEGGGEEFLFDSLTQGVMGLKAEMTHEGNQITMKVPAVMGTYKGELNEDMSIVDGTWEQAGQKFALKFEKSEESLKAKEFKRPQHPKAPFPYREEAVTFKNENAGIELAGTLTLPKASGQYPAVVLVSGSGPQDRDESLMGHKPFLVIADYLTRHGIAVLRYDDRGTAESKGDFSTATTRDFAEDAAAAVSYLKSHSEVDPNRVGLVGHSEGGLIAPIVEVDLKADLAHFVMLAGPGVDGGEIVISQSRAMAAAMEAEEEDLDRQEALVKKLVGAIRSGKSNEEVTKLINELIDAELALEKDKDDESDLSSAADIMRTRLEQMNSKWFRYFLDYDPAPTIQKVTCPVLAMIGSKDLQVLPELNLPAIEQALKAGGNKDYECVELADLNHLFQKAKTGSITEYQSIEETFNEEALKMMVDWINRH